MQPDYKDFIKRKSFVAYDPDQEFIDYVTLLGYIYLGNNMWISAEYYKAKKDVYSKFKEDTNAFQAAIKSYFE